MLINILWFVTLLVVDETMGLSLRATLKFIITISSIYEHYKLFSLFHYFIISKFSLTFMLETILDQTKTGLSIYYKIKNVNNNNTVIIIINIYWV